MALWAGKGAGLFHFTGRVQPKALRNLLDGLSPNGRPAFVDTLSRSDRRQGLEFIFNAPKSASVLWGMARERHASQIQTCHREAVGFSLLHIERALNWEGGWRSSLQGKHSATILAVVHENISEKSDPHLHSHVALLNFDGRLDGNKGCNNQSPAKPRRLRICRAVTRWAKASLGLVTELEQDGFRVTGEPDMSRHFSNGMNVQLPDNELFQCWRSEASDLGWGCADAEALLEFRSNQKAFIEKFETK